MTAPVAQSVLAPLQKAAYERITGDDTLMGLATGGVHDQVPEDKTRPFVQIGDAVEQPANSHDRFGRDTTMTFVVWTEYAGFAQAAAIADRIVQLFDHQRRAMSVVGHRVCSIRHVQAQPLRDPDPRYRQIPVAFRVLTEQE